MRSKKQIVSYSGYAVFVLAALAVFCPDALAAEETADWRPLFDLIMRWLNFVIIAVVLIKFGRKPIKDFFANRREEIDYQIKKYEKQKEAATEKIQEAIKILEDSTDRFEQVKQRIINDGERKKQQIIEKAQEESRLMLEGTQRKIQNQIVEARNVIRSELVDTAIALAEKKLPEEITAADEQKLIENYMEITADR
jgi:F-type H+-transporting ATPase subunit b